MKDVQIKRVTIDEVSQLQQIGSETFSETFSAVNDEADMKKYLGERFSVEQLSGELSKPQSEFYFATQGDDIVGYLKVNFGESQTELQDDNAMEIERIYVKKDFHGRNVGKILLEKGIQIALERGKGYVWLGVWGENARALRFYSKNGFAEFDQHIFVLGDKRQTDILMKLELKGGNV